MATITYDGQSLMLDGRRVWVVSGSVQYTRIPRDEWAERIHAARLAGLNTIETCVVWSRHEPRAGQFDFTGENDLRHFIELVQQAGLYCILRVGPYVGHGLDNGGLPAWLLEGATVGTAANATTLRLRTNSQPFLESCSRFITALSHQVRTLQAVVNPGRGAKKEEVQTGPIILIQNEMGWSCGFDTLAASYLGELHRYYREAGFAVPVVNANDLWQSVEGEIDGWTGSSNLLSHLRQLGTIRPTQPKMVMDLRIGRTDVWGKPAESSLTPAQTLRTLAESLAAGGQFNLSPFAGGTNFGFSGGSAMDAGQTIVRGATGIHDFAITSQDAGAPLDELGRPTPTYWSVRRLCTFASRFHRLFSHLEPSRHSVSLLPAQAKVAPTKGNQRRTTSPGGDSSPAQSGGVSVVHTSGSQGGVVFLFSEKPDGVGADESASVYTLLLPDGSTLPVDLRGQSAAWVLLDARVTGRSQIDYCNLSAFAMVGKVFVCYGPAGSRGVLSINGSPLETLVPAHGKPAFIHEHEGLVVVVCNTEGVDQVFVNETHVYVGVAGLDRQDRPVALPESRSCEVIDSEGRVTTHKFSANANAPAKRAGKLTMGEWTCARAGDHWLGGSARFASIDGPSDLVTLGAPYGYGWYRLRFNSSSAHKVKLAFPQSGHRLHLALDGEDCGVVGHGPGASAHAELSLKKKQHTLTVLAENFGRASAGVDLGEKVGLWGMPWVVTPVKLGKPKVEASEPVALLKFKAPLWRVHEDDVSDPARLTWTLQHRKRTPMIVRIDDFSSSDLPASAGGSGAGGGGGGVLLLNAKPIRFFQSGGCAPILLDPDQLQRGNNTLQIAMVGSTAAVADALAGALHVDECVEPLTEKGDWAFAKWEPPAPDAFAKPRPAAGQGDWPAWWRASFTLSDGSVPNAPLFFDATGLTKGQVYVNGRHLGRYFVATGAGKGVGPQKRYWVPRSYLNADGTNEIMIFDEHGAAPTKARVVADAQGSSLD